MFLCPVYCERSHPRQALTQRPAGQPASRPDPSPSPPCLHHTSVKTELLSPTRPVHNSNKLWRVRRDGGGKGVGFVTVLTVNMLCIVWLQIIRVRLLPENQGNYKSKLWGGCVLFVLSQTHKSFSYYFILLNLKDSPVWTQFIILVSKVLVFMHILVWFLMKICALQRELKC